MYRDRLKFNFEQAHRPVEEKLCMSKDDGLTELIAAIKEQKTETFLHLLQTVDVNQTLTYHTEREKVSNETLLHLAVKWAEPTYLRLILEKCDPNLVKTEAHYGKKKGITAHELALIFQTKEESHRAHHASDKGTCAQVFAQYCMKKIPSLTPRR